MNAAALRAIRKAIVGGIATAGTGIGTAMLDGVLTTPELITAAGAGLVAAFATWAIPNRPADPPA